MNDVTKRFSQSDAGWPVSSQIAQLLQTLPLPHAGTVLLVLPEAQAYDALRGAADLLSLHVVVMPVHSEQEGVARAIAQNKPCVVVCVPEIFGWVSKLAFLGGCLAIYTCGETGEGTLMDRASHFLPTREIEVQRQRKSLLLKLDRDGLPIGS